MTFALHSRQAARLRGDDLNGIPKIRKARPRVTPKQQPRITRGMLILAVTAAAGTIVAGALLWGSSSTDADPGPVHVHGLGINPAGNSLFIATHTGLFRVTADSKKAVRIADRYQDTMGFSIVGPNRFLGSGHPDVRERELPPLLGLIESTDAGKTWEPISLRGDADFHVLRSAGRNVYGYDASNDRLLTSTDNGRNWKQLDRPAPIVDLASDPSDHRRLVATTIDGNDANLYASSDAGRSWTRRNTDAVGFLAWPATERRYLVDGQGVVLVSSDGGRMLTKRGEAGGQPAAFLAVGTNDLYVALHDGAIKHSTDGGVTWTVRSSP